MMERQREPAHRQFEDMAVSHVLGGLSSNEGRLFRSHLVDCASCRARVGELRAIAHDLADVERDERRLAERRRVDTKAVEVEVTDDGQGGDGPQRRWFIGAIVVLLLLMGLVSWNFVLRGQNDRLAEQVAELEQATVAMEFGEEWAVDYADAASSARGAVTTLSGDLTLLLENVSDATHQVFLYDAEDQQVERKPVTPAGGRWLGVIQDIDDDAVRLVVRRTAALTDEPSGPTVLEAVRAE